MPGFDVPVHVFVCFGFRRSDMSTLGWLVPGFRLHSAVSSQRLRVARCLDIVAGWKFDWPFEVPGFPGRGSVCGIRVPVCRFVLSARNKIASSKASALATLLKVVIELNHMSNSVVLRCDHYYH